MDDLKQKFLGFVKKQGPAKSSTLPVSTPGIKSTCPVTSEKESYARQSMDLSPSDDEKILKSVDPVYYSTDDFDACLHELKNLPNDLDTTAIEKNFKTLRQQHHIISKKVLQLILQKQSPCNEEFKRIIELQEQLQLSLRICREGRERLNLGKQQFTTASLGILANYRKRQLVQGLLHSLNSIKTLQDTDIRLQELLNEENYQGAIALLLECQSAAFTYRHFTCVAALSGKLQDTLVMAEEQLDKALAKVCNHFDSKHYSKVQAGYSLLGKSQMAMDQLHMHFSTAIHNTAFNIVLGYVALCLQLTPTDADPENMLPNQKKSFKQLCKCVTPDSFIPCLVDLCKSLWEIMRSYNQVIAWHNTNLDSVDEKLNVDIEANVNKQYVKQKLESGLLRIWHDVQARVSIYLLGSDLAWYKFEEILQVLGVVHRLMEVGEEFCASKSEELQNSIRHQSGSYFKNYHRARLDEIRIFLENDGWEICPVKASFTILQLQEFKSLRNVLKCSKPKEQATVSTNSPDHSQDGSSVTEGFFLRYAETGTPFSIGLDEGQEEDILASVGVESCGYYSDDSDEEIPEELTRDFVDENVGETNKIPLKPSHKRELKAPILTNTTLTVLRQCGKYLQMSRLLQPIASEVIAGMIQLYEYYLYTVYRFFATDMPLPLGSNFMYNLKLQATVKRIEDSLIISEQLNDEQQVKVMEKIHMAYLSSCVDLQRSEMLYGLSERIVAVESTIFLAKQFEFLRGYLEHLIPATNRHFVQQFFSQTVVVTSELRQAVYMCVSFRAIEVRTILSLMSKVNWEVKEVMSQHSHYVDVLLRELQLFSRRFEETATKIPISRDVYNCLWDNVIKISCNTFVEGFSMAKKCSNGGRALMQLDFTQFLSKLEKLTSLRPIPYREYVEVYVKAYYLPESGFENWIRDHNEYSCKQLLGLISCACQNNKKSRQRLTSLIEDMERFGR